MEPEKKVKPMRVLKKPMKTANSTDSSTDLNDNTKPVGPQISSEPSTSTESHQHLPSKNETIEMSNQMDAMQPVQEPKLSETKSRNSSQQVTLESVHQPDNRTTSDAGKLSEPMTEKPVTLGSSIRPAIAKQPTQKPIKSVPAVKSEVTTTKPREKQKPLQPPKSMTVDPKPIKKSVKPAHAEKGHKKRTHQQTANEQKSAPKKKNAEQGKSIKPSGHSAGPTEANAAAKLKRNQVKTELEEEPDELLQKGIRCSRFGC